MNNASTPSGCLLNRPASGGGGGGGGGGGRWRLSTGLVWLCSTSRALLQASPPAHRDAQWPEAPRVQASTQLGVSGPALEVSGWLKGAGARCECLGLSKGGLWPPPPPAPSPPAPWRIEARFPLQCALETLRSPLSSSAVPDCCSIKERAASLVACAFLHMRGLMRGRARQRLAAAAPAQTGRTAWPLAVSLVLPAATAAAAIAAGRPWQTGTAPPAAGTPWWHPAAFCRRCRQAGQAAREGGSSGAGVRARAAASTLTGSGESTCQCAPCMLLCIVATCRCCLLLHAALVRCRRLRASYPRVAQHSLQEQGNRAPVGSAKGRPPSVQQASAHHGRPA